jgi:hypothetical protein
LSCLRFLFHLHSPTGHYDEPEILSYEMPLVCSIGADVRQFIASSTYKIATPPEPSLSFRLQIEVTIQDYKSRDRSNALMNLGRALQGYSAQPSYRPAPSPIRNYNIRGNNFTCTTTGPFTNCD